jgi:hypothetical protein
VWGTALANDNIVWGTALAENIVWGTAFFDNIVWGTSGADVTWATGTSDAEVFPDDAGEPLPDVSVEFGDTVVEPAETTTINSVVSLGGI